jgi:hypothetical protein
MHTFRMLRRFVSYCRTRRYRMATIQSLHLLASFYFHARFLIAVNTWKPIYSICRQRGTLMEELKINYQDDAFHQLFVMVRLKRTINYQSYNSMTLDLTVYSNTDSLNFTSASSNAKLSLRRVYNSKLRRFWSLFIVRFSEHNGSESGSVSVLRWGWKRHLLCWVT